MKILLRLACLLLLYPAAQGQSFLQMDTIDAPAELDGIIEGPIAVTYRVDFTGDGKPDYICRPQQSDPVEYSHDEFWISSDFQIIKKKKVYPCDIEYFWFIDLDNDPEPEIFSARGWTEGVDYCFLDQDLETGIDSVLFYFNPVLLDKGKNFWGYPWDITDLQLKGDHGNILLHCSLDHEIIRDGEIEQPEWQSMFPAIFFDGKSTQPDIHVGKITSSEWLSLGEIRERVLKLSDL